MPFLIIIIGIALIMINYYAIKKEKKSFGNALSEVPFQDKDYDMELFAIRKDMAESILDLQKEIRELKEYIDSKEIKKDEINDKVKVNENIYDTINEIENEPSVISEINFEKKEKIGTSNNRVEEIKAMIALGHTDDEICESLKIGKGEVLLIRGLFK